MDNFSMMNVIHFNDLDEKVLQDAISEAHNLLLGEVVNNPDTRQTNLSPTLSVNQPNLSPTSVGEMENDPYNSQQNISPSLIEEGSNTIDTVTSSLTGLREPFTFMSASGSTYQAPGLDTNGLKVLGNVRNQNYGLNGHTYLNGDSAREMKPLELLPFSTSSVSSPDDTLVTSLMNSMPLSQYTSSANFINVASNFSTITTLSTQKTMSNIAGAENTSNFQDIIPQGTIEMSFPAGINGMKLKPSISNYGASLSIDSTASESSVMTDFTVNENSMNLDSSRSNFPEAANDVYPQNTIASEYSISNNILRNSLRNFSSATTCSLVSSASQVPVSTLASFSTISTSPISNLPQDVNDILPVSNFNSNIKSSIKLPLIPDTGNPVTTNASSKENMSVPVSVNPESSITTMIRSSPKFPSSRGQTKASSRTPQKTTSRNMLSPTSSGSSSSDDADQDLVDRIPEPVTASCMNRKERWAMKQLNDWFRQNPNQKLSLASEVDCFLRESSGEELDLTLSTFIQEVRTGRKDRRYQTETLRQMLMAIQRYMRRQGRYVSFLSDPSFVLLQGSLALESMASKDQMLVDQCDGLPLLSNQMLDTLWEKKLLGEHNPQTLLDSQVVLFGLHFGIWSGPMYRSVKYSDGRIQLLKDGNGVEFIRFKVEGCRKGKKNPKVPKYIDIYGDQEHRERNIVHLYKEYNRRCPQDRRDDAYFLHPISNPTDDCWFQSQPVGKNALGKTMARIAKVAGITADIDNTSLKITCAVRMVENGSSLDIVKAITGMAVEDLKMYVPKSYLSELCEKSKQVEVKDEEDGEEENEVCMISRKRPAEQGIENPRQAKCMKTSTKVLAGSLSPRVGMNLRELLPNKLVVTSVVDNVYMDCNHALGPMAGISYSGFIPALLEYLASQLKFDYEIRVSPSGTYAPLLDNGEWGGLMADVTNGDAHVACGPLTIMASREDQVDFTHPFMSMGLSIIYKRPLPGEKLPFHDLESLMESGIPFGIVDGCSFHVILKRSKRPLHQKMIQLMDAWGDEVYVKSLVEAVQKVRNGGYAYLGDHTCADLFNKDLVAIGPRYLSQMFYAFATPKGSPLCRILGRAIMEMAEEGEIDELYDQCLRHKKWGSTQHCTPVIEPAS